MLDPRMARLYREPMAPLNTVFLQTMENRLLILNQLIIIILQIAVEVDLHRLLPLPTQTIMKDSQSPMQSPKQDILLRKRDYIPLRTLGTRPGTLSMFLSLDLRLPITSVLRSNNIIHRNHNLCGSRLKFLLNAVLPTIQSLHQHLILPLVVIPHAKGSKPNLRISIHLMEGESLGTVSMLYWKKEDDLVLCQFLDLHPKTALWKEALP